MFGRSCGSVEDDLKILSTHVCFHYIVLLNYPFLEKGCGFPFKQNEILFPSECYMLIMVEIGQVVFEKIYFECGKFIFTSPKKIAPPVFEQKPIT